MRPMPHTMSVWRCLNDGTVLRRIRPTWGRPPRMSAMEAPSFWPIAYSAATPSQLGSRIMLDGQLTSGFALRGFLRTKQTGQTFIRETQSPGRHLSCLHGSPQPTAYLVNSGIRGIQERTRLLLGRSLVKAFCAAQASQCSLLNKIRRTLFVQPLALDAPQWQC